LSPLQVLRKIVVALHGLHHRIARLDALMLAADASKRMGACQPILRLSA
jgi:hypothetical protein